MLALADVVKHYRDGDGGTVRALDGVSLNVASGELVALYGPSGSGKTTLLSIVAALFAPDRGEVRVDGRAVSGLTGKEAAGYRLRQVGYIPQAPGLMPGVPAVDNAALKLFDLRRSPREARREVAPLLHRLGLGERLKHRPEQLSAGERQRVAIARALAAGPKLVLADEPTGALDSVRSREVLQLLKELCDEQQVAMLLATHDPQAAAYADEAIALIDGQLVAHVPDVGAGLAGTR
ncbi:MAG TPA: ABC transporter ATP-binding protein [Conexibacter sp.]|jgi:putative ABC transport system ATP-binding protein